MPAEPQTHYPLCLTGKRACPPEDCGGVWGYAEFLEAIQDPPEAFYLDQVNQQLKRIR
ncbi:MAG: hypothetical protein CLLPBCKN_003951 [Chroococcidiopsis cubana SAG 39.79]|jgi:hypothetical protein|uniref:Plasmid pRiA4b Orf3-like domain-containing protein n=1 Tax=Chroococcidiopsis cubana SAG 39.79 TaxID=388085 RepID=A0AB37UHY1_9CYAN|nr:MULTISPECIES: hypothetical protein [Chroococcidiopsis]PSB45744.1 hypothetical protein C7B80_16100 [Cyanosarcina cf. burmensis CCALA 770]MDZ4874555.1 hypothetical protein [Chroococcidiopsis cubana SAG 39.79]PSB61578.1 hypothetical protein C7B79_21470 [Chroococcidiopsis cubana CCALA 043]RUT10986.1 hypothetical protein DSM107010_37460 [Chroococcidiopsis cubana SAG 39.79]URD52083.1 plasmid pRiA4b ORF-3 family protein [Chroococcidiopsis sp. CCNUC1]